MKVKLIFYIIWIIIPNLLISIKSVSGQNFDFLEIPFYIEGKQMPYAGIGGLKNPMFSNVDFNDDGKKDLFVFDREGEIILPFVFEHFDNGYSYRYANEYVADFPKLRVFALLVDFNGDGIEDIFTGGYLPSTIEVYKGKRTNGKLSFDLVKFGFNGSLGDFLQFYQTFYTQVYNSSIDIPAITDVDGDGDIDIVTFPSSSDKLAYYKNMTKEFNLGLDTLVYQLNTLCWGGFKEDDFSSSVFLSSSMDDCYNLQSNDKGEPRHSGSTTLLLDIDGDGDKDLLLGDLANDHIKLLINHGTNQKAWMNDIDNTFPSYDVAAKMQVFLAAYHVDVNNDGKRDLIITPNDRNDSERINHVWLYINKGSDQIPDFELYTKSFLIENIVSLGSGSHPCFVDINQDGLTDLLIGGNGTISASGDKRGWIEYYQNTGTTNEPAYTLISNDYLGFRNLAKPVLRIAPSAGDLDNDGDIDLVIGDFSGHLAYFENIAGPDNPITFNPGIFEFDSLDVANNAKPALDDLNGDGLTDIIIGKLNNDMNFVQNIGSIGNPKFSDKFTELPNLRNPGKIFPPQYNYFMEAGAPHIILTNEGKKLAFGSQGGGVRLYDIPGNDPTQTFPQVTDRLGNIFTGSRSVPSMADIDNDGFFELVLGNERGGITFYNTTLKTQRVGSQDFNTAKPIVLYPNPAFDYFQILNKNVEIVSFKNIRGESVNIEKIGQGYDVSGLPDGLYFIGIEQNSRLQVEKLLILK